MNVILSIRSCYFIICRTFTNCLIFVFFTDCKSLGIVPNYNIRSVRVATEKTIRSGEGYTPLYARGQVANLKSKAADAQISRYNTRFEKKDMHEDAFLKLLTDFDLVPAVIK